MLSNSNVVYQVNCSECREFYVGPAKRRLQQSMKKHVSSDSSALMKHHVETGHRKDYDLPEVLASDMCKTRLFVKETLKIQELKAFRSLTGNQGSFELRLW